MNATLLTASIGIVVAVASAPLWAGDAASPSAVAMVTQSAARIPAGMLASVSGKHDQRVDHADRRERRDGSPARARASFDSGMQAVSHTTGAGEPGFGWRYFSDRAAHRAVVISPQGEYYLSRGDGLRLAAVTQPAT